MTKQDAVKMKKLGTRLDKIEEVIKKVGSIKIWLPSADDSEDSMVVLKRLKQDYNNFKSNRLIYDTKLYNELIRDISFLEEEVESQVNKIIALKYYKLMYKSSDNQEVGWIFDGIKGEHKDLFMQINSTSRYADNTFNIFIRSMTDTNERSVEKGWTDRCLEDQLNDLNKELGVTFDINIAEITLAAMAYDCYDEENQDRLNEMLINLIKGVIDEYKKTEFNRQAFYLYRVDSITKLLEFCGLDLLRIIRFNGKDKTIWPFTTDNPKTLLESRLQDYTFNINVVKKLNLLNATKYRQMSILQSLSILVLKQYLSLANYSMEELKEMGYITDGLWEEARYRMIQISTEYE